MLLIHIRITFWLMVINLVFKLRELILPAVFGAMDNRLASGMEAHSYVFIILKDIWSESQYFGEEFCTDFPCLYVRLCTYITTKIFPTKFNSQNALVTQSEWPYSFDVVLTLFNLSEYTYILNRVNTRQNHVPLFLIWPISLVWS